MISVCLVCVQNGNIKAVMLCEKDHLNLRFRSCYLCWIYFLHYFLICPLLDLCLPDYVVLILCVFNIAFNKHWRYAILAVYDNCSLNVDIKHEGANWVKVIIFHYMESNLAKKKYYY